MAEGVVRAGAKIDEGDGKLDEEGAEIIRCKGGEINLVDLSLE